jgi:methylaspartate ammonia-lyase
MPDLPTITSILTVPGLSTTGGDSTLPKTGQDRGISVGIVLDGDKVTWGQCQYVNDGIAPDYPEGFQPVEAVATIHDIVQPILVGQQLSSSRELFAHLETLTETAVILETIPKAVNESNDISRGISRRDLLTGFRRSPGGSNGGRADTREVTVERLLHPAIRFGLSEALLAATALSQGITMAEVIAREYDLPIAEAPINIQAELGVAPLPAAVERMIYFRPAALAFEIPGLHPEVVLGDQGENLQRTIRQLSKRITANTEGYRPAIHVNLNGGLARLVDLDVGKMLGNLFGMEKAAAPCPLHVESPIMLRHSQPGMEKLRQLREYVRMRQMKVRFVADNNELSPEECALLIRENGIDLLRVNVIQMGGIHPAVEMIIESWGNNVGVILEGQPTGIASHIALATQPELISVPARN